MYSRVPTYGTCSIVVIPAHAGIQAASPTPDPGVRRDDIASTATFVQTVDCGEETPCCHLTFTRAPLFIAVEEDNCGMFHGARAYFSGEYRKVK